MICKRKCLACEYLLPCEVSLPLLCKCGVRHFDDLQLETVEAHTPAPIAYAAGYVPQRGPGTELRKLLGSLGITEFSGCDCAGKARQMDHWGSAGCRQHFAEIHAWLTEAYEQQSWGAKLKAAAASVVTGLAIALSPLDPIASLLELAIANAERVPGH